LNIIHVSSRKGKSAAGIARLIASDICAERQRPSSSFPGITKRLPLLFKAVIVRLDWAIQRELHEGEETSLLRDAKTRVFSAATIENSRRMVYVYPMHGDVFPVA